MRPDKIFEDLKKKAEKVVGNKDEIENLLKSAYEKAAKKGGLFSRVWDDFSTLFRMMRAWLNGTYKDLPWGTLILVVVLLLYLVSPFDLIPDFIPVLGLLDDIALMIFVFNSIRGDLKKFKKWEENTISDK